MNRAFPVLSVLIALLFTLSVAMIGCKPTEQEFTESSHTTAETNLSQDTGDSQAFDASVQTQVTEAYPEPTTGATDPVDPVQGTTTPTEGTTQPTQALATPTQGVTIESTHNTQETTSTKESSSQSTTQDTVLSTTQATVIPTTQPTDSTEAETVTYQDYIAMSGAEQMDFWNTFDSMSDFHAWFATAEEEYLEGIRNNEGNFDLDDIVNGNK